MTADATGDPPEAVSVPPAVGHRAVSAPRVTALDGLRGFAMILVLVSHGWELAPYDDLVLTPWRQVFMSGNLGVTIFFVTGGFLLVDGLLRRGEQADESGTVRAVLRRLVRLAGPVYLLLAVVVVVAAVQSPPDYPAEMTRNSVLAVATFTWNWYAQNNALLARPDLGHLWYISVYLQLTVALAALVSVCRGGRRNLIAALVVGILVVTWWRGHVAVTEDPYLSLLRTSTRADGMLWGALAAAALPYLARVRRNPGALFVTGCVALVGLLLIPADTADYLTWDGFVACAATAAVVLALQWLDRGSGLPRPLTWPGLVALGRASLSIYVWHYPLFWFIGAHTPGWSWPVRTLVALAALAVVVILTRRFVEAPVDRFLTRRLPSRVAADSSPPSS